MLNKCPQSRPEARTLRRALQEKELDPILEYEYKYTSNDDIHIDLFFEEAKLAIEVDGPRHKFSKRQMSSDITREKELEKKGIKTLRYDNSRIHGDLKKVVNEIVDEINKRIKLKI